ncbi:MULTISPECIES: DNA polymerase III subunit delta [unclassified Lysobacter]|uniref:DNA polymerase III subunit delta n=1 Tax=unclassified Lysobacter TaxID=2635362 RepID=UPI0006FE4A58|nr:MULTISPECIES: DNA polymerase III subunit delta [unclassified Lysobacter]KQZ59912.1 DNA polymerase III subunit delta [Lysobacter sp. Root559]KRA77212.1 DNA polymerase III subunit delta [Lysobacter sp. Root667]KRC38361.1 DNA polymerase III subunit delta [Lysobacter sp. Root76]KRD71519.1 DNA polymerase III subunit delta [Lysobacter sp. Root96]
MELKPEQLAAQVASEPLRPAYLIAGPEPLRVLEAADAVRAAARQQGIAEREVFEAEGNQREPDWNALEASFRAPSLFASRRLVELRLPTGKPGKDGAEVISGFCADPPQDVCLLVSCGEWSKQHGGKWSEAIGRVGRVAIAWQIKPHELPEWIERRLRARGLRADRDAVQSLADRVEGNLLAAAQEVDKLALLSDGEAIDLARMESLVADAARYDVFRVVDAAMNGQGAQVSRMLAGLRAEGEAVPALLGMVVIELQRGAALARVNARGGNLSAEFKAQRVWDSKQPMYRRALQRHDARRWDAFVAQAGRVDRMAKGREAGDAWIALERLLLAVAEPRAARLLVSGGA